jgi:hypothetical protein
MSSMSLEAQGFFGWLESSCVQIKFLTLPVTFIPRSETEVAPTIDTSVNAAVDDGISRARHTTTPPCTQLSGRIAESTFDVVFCHGTHKESLTSRQPSY